MIKFIKSALNKNDFPNSNREVVFVGRSNVGKSSLLNALYNQKIAYVGNTPGKTRMINFFDVDNKYIAVDVPGYGYAKRSKKEAILFGKMMEDYFSRTNIIKLVVVIVDSRIGLTDDDKDMIDYWNECNLNYIIVANKIDKLSNNQLNNNKRLFFNEFDNVIYVSAQKKTNLKILMDYINNSLYYLNILTYLLICSII